MYTFFLFYLAWKIFLVLSIIFSVFHVIELCDETFIGKVGFIILFTIAILIPVVGDCAVPIILLETKTFFILFEIIKITFIKIINIYKTIQIEREFIKKLK